jgi:hypothetical protein
MYSKGDVAVSLRMLRALGDVATSTPDAAYRRTLVGQGRRILAGCAEKLGEGELARIRVRLGALEQLVDITKTERSP